MERYEFDEKSIEKGLHQLIRREANVVLDNAKGSAEEAGSAADRFADLLGFAKRYIDVREYEGIINKAFAIRAGEID